MANMIFSTFVISAKAGIQKLGGAAWVLKQVQDDNEVSLWRHWKVVIGNSLKIENCKLIIAHGVRCG